MNKKAILYVRVSTDDQADHGYSLRDQEERLMKYCEIKSIDVVMIYREDHSAKDFNRLEFKKLMQFAREKKKDIDLLLFIKWDRFSRNVSESYRVIDAFYKLDIEPLAIEQPVDMSIPENKFMLSMFLTAPEVENERRSINVTQGMRRARREGRWICTAPKGYSNKRDENNKPIIVPDFNAKYILSAFEQIAEGHKPIENIRKELNNQGFVCSKSNFARLICNPVYTGKIMLETYKNEAEEVVDGIHEPIISEELFNRVQDILSGRRKRINQPLIHRSKAELPLRGLLFCPKCSQKLTGSGSKGNGGRYFYYHCNHCHQERNRADVVEKHIIRFLRSFQINPDYRQFIQKVLSDNIREYESHQSVKQTDINVKLDKLKARITNLQDKFADGEITGTDYHEMKVRYMQEMASLEVQVSEQNVYVKDLDNFITRALDIIENMDQLYENADIELKQQLLGSIFTGKLYFAENKVRTTEINEVINLVHKISKACSGNKKGQLTKKKQLSRVVIPEGVEPSTS